MKVLVLGGTTEASAICRALVGEVDAVLSLAGRTRAPVLPGGVAVRRGGFGGVEGLVRFLRDEGVEALVDATHPFARRMHGNAAVAAEGAGVPRVCVLRPAWEAVAGDRWTVVDSMAEAVAALGPVPWRVLLTVGQGELEPFLAAPWHHYLVRSVEPPNPAHLPPGARSMQARGPFTPDGERALLAAERIEVLVSKNSGGTAVAAKLQAARALGVAVVMVARPPEPPGPIVRNAAAALAWVRHQGALRGV